MAKFKDRLRELRKERGLTQTSFAKDFGKTRQIIQKYESGDTYPLMAISRVSIGNYERGDREPTACILIQIANYFNVSTDYLLGLSDSKEISNELDIKSISTDELLKELYGRMRK